jgi:putative hydrolase of the HAD superfamily
MIKAIIFDCFGVLTTDVWLDFCDNLPAGADLARASELNRAHDRGLITEQEYIDGVESATGQVPPSLEALHRGEIVKNRALLNLINRLKTDYKIGLMSNISSDWITSEFLTETEQNLFDSMVLSYQVGMIKPDPLIYTLACERLRVTPDEAIMVDDRPQYVEGARAVGLYGVWYEDMHSFTAQLNELLATDY